jgi:hypothetical protein
MPTEAPLIFRPGRYAILWHQGIADPHFDFLLELTPGAALKTWRLAAWPLFATGPTPAPALADHRNLYLHYEGPISDNRGSVTRIEGGACQVQDAGPAPQSYHVRLEDGRGLLITATDRGLWQFQVLAWSSATMI